MNGKYEKMFWKLWEGENVGKKNELKLISTNKNNKNIKKHKTK